MYYSKEAYPMESPVIQQIALSIDINLKVKEVVALLHHVCAIWSRM